MTQKLTWRKAAWPDKTYHAVQGDLSYTVDYNGTRWVVRGWKESKFCLYRDGATMREMKAVAQTHADANS